MFKKASLPVRFFLSYLIVIVLVLFIVSLTIFVLQMRTTTILVDDSLKNMMSVVKSEPVVKQPEKGIQNATLESLLTHIPGKDEDPVSCEVLSEKAGLSKVTIRRYMNYLIENDRAESIVDYQTGGRPKITYRLTEK